MGFPSLVLSTLGLSLPLGQRRIEIVDDFFVSPLTATLTTFDSLYRLLA